MISVTEARRLLLARITPLRADIGKSVRPPRRPDPQLHLVRVAARSGPPGDLYVRLSGGQESHMLRVRAQANALALLPDGDGVRAGGSVEVMLLDPGVPGPTPRSPSGECTARRPPAASNRWAGPHSRCS